MPKGVYIRTEETKGILRNAHVGKILSLEHKENIRKTALQRGFGKWNSGKTLSLSTKQKIGLKSKLRKRTPESGEKISKSRLLKKQQLGYLNSPQTREKMSISHIGKNLGAENPAWKGGITPVNTSIRMSPQYKAWRESVFKRDNFTCQKCAIGNVYLQADHIKPFAYYPELRFNLENGQTLCVPCHRQTNTYGNRMKRR